MTYRFNLFTLIIRNLGQSRVRSLLSVLMVALGVATVIGVDVASSAILNSLSGSEDAQTFMLGLIDQFDRLIFLIGLMVTIERSFNTITNAPEGRPWLLRITIYWTVLSISPLAMALMPPPSAPTVNPV